MKKVKQPRIDMQVIHRDHNFLCEFISVQETFKEGLLVYSSSLFDRLEVIIWDHLDKEDKAKFELHVKALSELIATGINSLEYYAKKELKS